MRRPAIIACIAAVVLLSAGIVVLTLLPATAPVADVNERVTMQSGAVADLINESPYDVAGIHFIPREGIQYTIRLNKVSSEPELESTDAIFSGLPSVMLTVFHSVITLTDLTVVTNEADNAQLEMFGLNEPVMCILVDRIDGTSIKLDVGTVQAAGHGRYVRTQNSREIFLLNERQSTVLVMDIEDLYDTSFFPSMKFPDEESAIDAIDYVLIETENSVLELRKRTEEELMALVFGSTSYLMLQPVEAEANDNVVQADLLAKITGLKPGSIQSIQPDDLSAYGLDKPSALTVTTDDWSGTLLIGNHDAGLGGRFVMLEGYNTVLLDTHGDYSFLNVSFSQLRSPLVWIHNISDVASVTFELDGVMRKLLMVHNTDDRSVTGSLDDIELSDNNIRGLYVAALSITQSGETDSSIPADYLPVYRITMNFIDGGNENIELYQIRDTQFLIVHNGKNTGLFITRMSLQQNLLSRFEIIDTGGEIP